MKVKITGDVRCRCCNWEGVPKQLKEENDGETIKCPNCDHILMDFSNGNFLMQDIECGNVTIE